MKFFLSRTVASISLVVCSLSANSKILDDFESGTLSSKWELDDGWRMFESDLDNSLVANNDFISAPIDAVYSDQFAADGILSFEYSVSYSSLEIPALTILVDGEEVGSIGFNTDRGRSLFGGKSNAARFHVPITAGGREVTFRMHEGTTDWDLNFVALDNLKFNSSYEATKVSVSNDILGDEYARSIEVADVNPITISMGRNYAAGDILTLRFAGAMPISGKEEDVIEFIPDLSGPAANAVEFLEYDNGDILFQVKNALNINDVFVVSGLKLDVSAVAAGDTVTLSSFGTIDTVEGAKRVDTSEEVSVITIENDFDFEIETKLDGRINLSEGRQEFVEVDNSEGNATSDILQISARRDLKTVWRTSVESVTYTLNGDFSFLDGNSDGDLADKADGSIVASIDGSSITFNSDMTQAIIFDTEGKSLEGFYSEVSNLIDVTVSVPKDSVIPAQQFTLSVELCYLWANSYQTSAIEAPDKCVVKQVLDEVDAGSWVLNGANVHVPHLPFSDAYSQSITISNTSTVDGEVSVIFYTGGGKVELNDIASVKGKGVTDISSVVREVATEAGLSGQLAFDLIVNVPESAVSVKASYFAKSDGDRVNTL